MRSNQSERCRFRTSVGKVWARRYPRRMDELDGLTDVCPTCRHTMATDTCTNCGWVREHVTEGEVLAEEVEAWLRDRDVGGSP